MVGKYNGHFDYSEQSVKWNAPDSIGVYYMGTQNSDGSLGVYYIGRALGENVTIKSRLLNHLSNNEWPGISLFGFVVCSTEKEAEDLEKAEILRLNPKYNQRVG